jgi:putative SOS response-associated peptidase YedK
LVPPIHAKAMPVLLTATKEYEAWLSAPMDEVLALQRPLPNELLAIVATGMRTDEGVVVETF